MDDVALMLARIYDAVGDGDRWRRLESAFAGRSLPPEIERHLTAARAAHFRQLALARDIGTLKQVHDQLTVGVCVVTSSGRLLWLNAAAQRQLQMADGLRADDGHLVACDQRCQLDIARLLKTLADDDVEAAARARGRPCPFVVVPRGARTPLCAIVLSVPTAAWPPVDGEEIGALILLDPESRDSAPRDVLRDLFHLTGREAELAARLAEGLSLDQVAAGMGIAISTARTFLSRVAAKTGTRSQPELVLRLLTVPPAPPGAVVPGTEP